jgi:hypothetical protein
MGLRTTGTSRSRWHYSGRSRVSPRCSRERCFGGRPRRGNLSVGCLTADECDRDGDNIGVGAVRLHRKGHAHLADDREVFR